MFVLHVGPSMYCTPYSLRVVWKVLFRPRQFLRWFLRDFNAVTISSTQYTSYSICTRIFPWCCTGIQPTTDRTDALQARSLLRAKTVYRSVLSDHLFRPYVYCWYCCEHVKTITSMREQAKNGDGDHAAGLQCPCHNNGVHFFKCPVEQSERCTNSTRSSSQYLEYEARDCRP